VKIFIPGFMIVVGVAAAITPCSIVIVLPLVCGAFLVGLGRRSAMDTDDTSELPTQLTLYAISALFGSLVNTLMVVVVSLKK
jgi:hypothetical protein